MKAVGGRRHADARFDFYIRRFVVVDVVSAQVSVCGKDGQEVEAKGSADVLRLLDPRGAAVPEVGECWAGVGSCR